MVEKITIVICHYGGHFVTSNDGSMQYMGGEAKAFDLHHDSTVDGVKSELALEMKCDSSSLKLRYFLPGDTGTPLNIVIDKDLQRMVEFHENARTIHVYVLNDNALDRDAGLIIENRANKAIVGDSTSFAGPSSPPAKRPTRQKAPSSPRANSTPIQKIGWSSPPANSTHIQKVGWSAPSGNYDIPLVACSWDKLIIGVGQEFKSVLDFRCALGKFAMAGGFDFIFIKNDPNRVKAKCRDDNCKWRIYASTSPKKPIFKIKRYVGSHTCGRGGPNAAKHPHSTKYWLVEVLKDKLTDSPDCKPRDIVEHIYQDYGFKLSYNKAWRVMEIARKTSPGSLLKQYDNLPQFCTRVTETNPKSLALLTTTEGSRFKSLFVCFYASQFGFNEGCRPIIFLNGTSLKDGHQGTCFSATSVDANDGMFPVAFGIVDMDSEANWVWFLNELKQVLSSNRRITFISNRQKELIRIVHEVFEDSYHAFCMNHLSECFQNEVKGGFSPEVKDFMVHHLWRAAYATHLPDFEKEINEIRKISEDAVNWVLKSQPDHWSNTFFQGDRYNHLTSDASKLFNEWVLAAQDLTILKMLHRISCKLMELMNTRRVDSEKWDTRLAPSAEEHLKNDILESQTKKVLHFSGDQYEVLGNVIRFVDLNAWTCSCKQWQIRGRPCPHAIAVFTQIGCSPYDFCARYLTTEMYRVTYSNPINSIPDDGYSCADGEQTPVHPPLMKRKPGRPKRMKSLIPVENRTVHCSRCGGMRHNKVTCKEPIRELQNEQSPTEISFNMNRAIVPLT